MPFDIDRFMASSRAVETDDLDWAYIRRVGVSDDEERVLRYMADVESYTILYLRDVLTGHLARDPEVVGFLSCWVYEETHHGRAIDRFLTACGRPPPPDQFTRVAERASVRERFVGLISRTAAELTPIFSATHMTWGALQEMIAAATYTQLSHRTQNEQLAVLLRRLARDERRHQSFYYEQARKRLASSRAAQRLCRVGMWRFWVPVGLDVAGGEDEGGFIMTMLYDNDWGRREWERLDAAIARLPGLHGFDQVSRQLGALVRRFRRKFPEQARALADHNATLSPRFATSDAPRAV